MTTGTTADGTAMTHHALITGAGTGIGAAISRLLASQGMAVSLLGRRPEPLEAVHEALVGSGHHSSAIYPCDVTDRSRVDDVIALARSHLGPITIVVNCAGAATTAPFRKLSAEQWHQSFDVNVHGVFNVTQSALTDMLTAGWGRVINVASTASLKGYTYVSAYCAAKHAVLGLTRALALEVAKQGITVNAVCPGYTDTDIVRHAVADIVAKTGRSEAEAQRHFSDSNPRGELVQPEQVAAMVGWLASDQAANINGQAIAIDGGETVA